MYGSLGSIDVYGRPVFVYRIDGVEQGFYQEQVLSPELAQSNVLFFQSPPLDKGTHTLESVNDNGTAPSEFWLDYIICTPGVDTSSPPLPPGGLPTGEQSPPPRQPRGHNFFVPGESKPFVARYLCFQDN